MKYRVSDMDYVTGYDDQGTLRSGEFVRRVDGKVQILSGGKRVFLVRLVEAWTPDGHFTEVE